VRRLEHGLLHWRIRVRRLPVLVRVHHLELRSGAAGGEGPGVGRRAWPRVGTVFASPAPLVADPAGRYRRRARGASLSRTYTLDPRPSGGADRSLERTLGDCLFIRNDRWAHA